MQTLNEESLKKLVQQAREQVEVGSLYTHFRSPDKEYKVIDIGMLEATSKPCVIYQALYDTGKTIWVRAFDDFVAKVEYQGKKVPRFSKKK